MRSLASLALALTLCPLASDTLAVRFPADTADLLSGHVLWYNLAVDDDGQTYWGDQSLAELRDKLDTACQWLEEQAAAQDPPVPLDIDHVLARTSILRDASHGLGREWVNEAVAFLGHNDADGDSVLSDDVVLLWKNGYDAVVIGFHVWTGGPTHAVDELQQEIYGPLAIYYGTEYDFKAYAHELLHAFGACDEYGGTPCFCDNGFLLYSYGKVSPNGETNANRNGCLDDGHDCVMRGGAPFSAFCEYTPRQIGWGNADGDGEADAVDPEQYPEMFFSRLTSLEDFRRSVAVSEFVLTDVAGGELQGIRQAEGLVDMGDSTWHHVQTLPLPLLGRGSMFSNQGYLFLKGQVVWNGQYYITQRQIYSAPCLTDSTIGPLSPAGAAVDGWDTEFAAGYGYVYTNSENLNPLLRCAKVRGNGTIDSTWVGLDFPFDAHLRQVQLAVAKGHLYAHWHSYRGGWLQPYDYYVAGAPIKPNGILGEWSEAEFVGSQDHSGLSTDLVASGSALYLVNGPLAQTWYCRLGNDGAMLGWVESHQRPPQDFSTGAGVVGAGCLFLVGGRYDLPDVAMSRIAANDSLEAWIPLQNLPVGTSRPGVCVTSENGKVYLWEAGGQSYSQSGNDLYRARLDLTGTYPAQTTAWYRMSFGAPKTLRSIGWRSTNPDSVGVRVRKALAQDTQFEEWFDAVLENEHRMLLWDTPVSALEFEILATNSPQGSPRMHDLSVVYTDPNPGETPAGNDVLVTLPSSGGQCRFDAVTQAGTTTADPVPEPPAPPSGAAIRSAYDLTTTAEHEGTIEVGVRYDPQAVGSEARLKLQHFVDGYWHDITRSVDPIGRQVWGEAPSLSMFAVTEDTTDVTSGVPGMSEGGHGAVLSVAGNRPNPFTDLTTIRLLLPARDRATLRVYDAAGRLVRTLLDGMFDAGMHEIVWDGKDDRGRPVGSGVFFIRLDASPQHAGRKAIVLR